MSVRKMTKAWRRKKSQQWSQIRRAWIESTGTRLAIAGALMLGLVLGGSPTLAETLPWQQGTQAYDNGSTAYGAEDLSQAPDPYRDNNVPPRQQPPNYLPPTQYAPPGQSQQYGSPPRGDGRYRAAPDTGYSTGYGEPAPRTVPGYRDQSPPAYGNPVYGNPNGQPYGQYQPGPPPGNDRYRYGTPSQSPRYGAPPPVAHNDDRGTYSSSEIIDAGHRFFGKISGGIARAVESVFRKKGRPNAYILGEEAGGSIIAGLRYGEGNYFTKWGQEGKIYWQGPSIGYDFGATGAKTMILVYNLRDVRQLFQRYAAVDGQAYLVGGVGITFEKRDDVMLARIQSGVGLRFGANIGYIKYSARPTWNPF